MKKETVPTNWEFELGDKVQIQPGTYILNSGLKTTVAARHFWYEERLDKKGKVKKERRNQYGVYTDDEGRVNYYEAQWLKRIEDDLYKKRELPSGRTAYTSKERTE